MPISILSRLLSKGAEIFAGGLIRSGFSEQLVRERLLGRFIGLREPESGVITNIGREGVLAGSTFMQLDPSAGLDLSQIPVNEFLFGTEPNADRFLFDADVFFPQYGVTWRIRVRDVENKTRQELEELALQMGREELGNSPPFGNQQSPNDIDAVIADVSFIERRY